MCILNQNNEAVKFGFALSTGIDAKDYTSIISQNDLKTSEITARQIEDLSNSLHKTHANVVKQEDRMTEHLKHFSKNGFLYGAITIGVMLTSSLMGYQVLKRYFKNHKDK